jgi:hypothetical protein
MAATAQGDRALRQIAYLLAGCLGRLVIEMGIGCRLWAEDVGDVLETVNKEKVKEALQALADVLNALELHYFNVRKR